MVAKEVGNSSQTELKISALDLIFAATICLLLVVQARGAASDSTELVALRSGDGPDNYGSGWLIRVLRELFDDIDWQAIEKAREQVEKFVKKVDRLIKTFRGTETRPSGTKSTGAESNNRPDDGEAQPNEGLTREEARLMAQGKWWTSGPKLSVGQPATASAALAGELADANDVKAMLERVACFLGYMRILTNSNEALAELDAAKVVSNLFGASSSTTGGGFFKRWFG